MALNSLVDSRDVRFALFEVIGVQNNNQYPAFADFDQDTFESVLELAEQLSVEQIKPTAAEGDKVGCVWNPDTKEVYSRVLLGPLNAFYESRLYAWPTAEIGGRGMPSTVFAACMEYVIAAHLSAVHVFRPYPRAMELVDSSAPKSRTTCSSQNDVRRVGRHKCLTEPEAGSDVEKLKTKAGKQLTVRQNHRPEDFHLLR
jgi:alkylation response protein AidB-like acyl-CoA dehydrogenase